MPLKFLRGAGSINRAGGRPLAGTSRRRTPGHPVAGRGGPSTVTSSFVVVIAVIIFSRDSRNADFHEVGI